MSKNRINLGKIGEQIAIRLLKRKGYIILHRNFSCKLGEIDIIAKDKDAIVFIEVRTKSSDEYGLPFESIDKNKKRRLIRLAWFYIKGRNLQESLFRFDVVSILSGEKKRRFKVALIKDAFGES